jgi:hypothetical protein
LNIDGNGDVWVVSGGGAGSVWLLAGDDTKGHPPGTKTGDLIHKFTGGSIQKVLTDASVDPAEQRRLRIRLTTSRLGVEEWASP